MGQRTPFGTYTNEPSVNTAELRAAKKLSLYGTTEPRYCCTSSGYSRIASEMAQKITPCFLSSSRKVVATETESNTFFFQAEDGIRDLIVTGVQTCALPI